MVSNKIVTLLCSFAVASLVMGKLKFLRDEGEVHWAVLVAGSDGWWNYRHQSDVFHAYHILRDNGIPEENIIVLAYDDIADNRNNPFPGQVFNKPDPEGEGVNVYEGVKIDYRGADVNPEVFLAVLEGNQEAVKGKGTEKVVQSTSKDNVFVFYSDHGAPGLVAFPGGSVLYANKLIETLKKMRAADSFKELVFYLEACESGSMFDKILESDLNVYATTAATPHQSSWATYCYPDDVINNKHVGACLGDEYSVNWMEHSDDDNGLKSSLAEQFEHVRRVTKLSQAQEYGQFEFRHKDIGQYQGNHVEEISPKNVTESQSYKEYLAKAKNSRMDSRKVKLNYLEAKASNPDATYQDLDDYFGELRHVAKTDIIFLNFNKELNIEDEFTIGNINFECLESSVTSYREVCNHWGEYDLGFVKNIAYACEKNSSEEIKMTFEKICANEVA